MSWNLCIRRISGRLSPMIRKSWSVAYLSWCMAAIFSSFLERENTFYIHEYADLLQFFVSLSLILIYVSSFIEPFFNDSAVRFQPRTERVGKNTLRILLQTWVILLKLCFHQKLVQIWRFFIHLQLIFSLFWFIS